MQQSTPFHPFTLNLGGRLLAVERPQVMGILNVTPDSFYAESRADSQRAIRERVARMIAEGADMIDIGAYSSRPGAADVSPAEEIGRLREGMRIVRELSGEIPVSVDTFRAEVARAAIEEMGADIINDISGGDLDPDMAPTVASLRVPYIVMHMRGNPATMQSLTDYPGGVTADVIKTLSEKIDRLRLMGVADVIADPGFGFAKTVGQNYELMGALGRIGELLGVPLLVGISRKSMFTKPLGITPAEALPATTAANTIAMLAGAAFIRVHDVGAAVQARTVVELTTAHPHNTILNLHP